MTAARFFFGLAAASLIALGIRECRAAEEWDAIDKGLFAGQVVLQAVDAAQTDYIRRHPEQFREVNPLYGNPPNLARVVVVKAALVGGLYWLVRDMNSPSRKLILGVADVVQLSVVAHNAQIGVRIGF